jgi:hypothetical protein
MNPITGRMSSTTHKLLIFKAKTNDCQLACCNLSYIKTQHMYQYRKGLHTGEKWESDKNRNKTQPMIQDLRVYIGFSFPFHLHFR